MHNAESASLSIHFTKKSSLQDLLFYENHDANDDDICSKTCLQGTLMRGNPPIRRQVLWIVSYLSILRNLWWRDIYHMGTHSLWLVCVLWHAEDRFQYTCIFVLFYWYLFCALPFPTTNSIRGSAHFTNHLHLYKYVHISNTFYNHTIM